MKGHDRLHQSVQLPKPTLQEDSGREIFAKWEPKYEDIAHTFWTDANGYDLIERDVFKNDSESFSASFYPVDASITMHDSIGERSFTVWNDRPQAGSVHYDKSIKLLVQRALLINDHGGIDELLYQDRGVPDQILTVNFQVKAYPSHEAGKWIATRKRSVVALSSFEQKLT